MSKFDELLAVYQEKHLEMARMVRSTLSFGSTITEFTEAKIAMVKYVHELEKKNIVRIKK